MTALTRPWSLPVSLAGAVLAGVTTHLAFPGYSWWASAPLGLALLALCLRGHGARAGTAVGYVFGLALLLPLLRWTGLQVGWFPWIALSLFLALYYALAGLLLGVVGRLPRGWQRVLCGVGVWVAVEALLGRYPFGGFGWSRLGFSQSTSPLLGWAALAGVPVLSAVVVALGLLLVEAVVGRGVRSRVGALAVVLVLVLAGPAVPTPVQAEQGTLQVAGVQGNVPRLGLEFNAQRRAVLDNHARVTHVLAEEVAAGRTPAPELVVWPENASDIDPLTNADATAVIQGAVDAVGATTLVGGLTVRDRQLYNTVLQWEPGTGPGTLYDKRAPVPFAEYVPYRTFFRALTPLVDRAGSFSAGEQVGLLRVSARDGRSVPLGVLICFEVVPDHLVGDVMAAGAHLLVVPTNNATFGLSDESRQQLAISRVRAVQTGRSVAHVSTVGVSALVAPDGTILDGSELFTADILTAALPLRSTHTVATRAGVLPELGLVLLGLVGVAAGARSRLPGPASGTSPLTGRRRTLERRSPR